MSDPTAGRQPGTGDGDNFDPDVHDVDDLDLGSPGSVHAGQPDGADPTDPGAGDDDVVRASEIDDITEGIHRPAGGLGPDEAGQALADATDAQAAAAPDVGAEESDVSEIDVLALLDERNQFKEMAQRVQAEFQNFKRVSAERAQADSDRATGRLAEAMLPVLDAAEAAFVNHPDEIGPLLNQMLVELMKSGLEAPDPAGQPFDPDLAEAVAHEPGGGGDPVVADVLRTGYSWKGKTLRPAMVRTKD